jgi:hypothetical protein
VGGGVIMSLSIENMSSDYLKIILKENRKYKNRLYWKVWRELNERYNMGEV